MGAPLGETGLKLWRKLALFAVTNIARDETLVGQSVGYRDLYGGLSKGCCVVVRRWPRWDHQVQGRRADDSRVPF
jgi:hypothetical protein